MISDHDIVAPPFMNRYIELVKHQQVNHAIIETGEIFLAILKKATQEQVDHAYAEGKWTVKEVLQHVIDAERVFAYRALWFARNDAQALPGFDENAWAENAPVDSRSWNDMVMEFDAVRKATILLFASFDEDQLKAYGTANGKAASVIALGYVCAGHVAHHTNILRERYLIA